MSVLAVTDNTKLAVIVHENNEITVKDGRGLPHVCLDCRHSGWLTKYEYGEYKLPRTCLLYSGGADPADGDRIILDTTKDSYWHDDAAKKWRKKYPLCSHKNQDGQCEDFCRAKPMLWHQRWFWFLRPSRRAMRK